MGEQWPCYDSNPNAEEFRKLFVGGLDPVTTVETLQEYFAGYGTVEKCDIMTDKNSKKSKGFGFITFETSDPLDEIQEKRPHQIDSKKIETKRATPKSQQYWATNKLYIKDFSKETEEDELVSEMKAVFGKYGKIKDVNLVKDKEGALKGFGFIEFEDEDPVDKCNLYRKFTVKGTPTFVAKAYPQEKNQYAGRGRGGGFGYNMGYQDYYNYNDYYHPGNYNYRGDNYGRAYGGYNNYNDYYRGGRGYSRGGGGGRPYRGGRY